MRPIFLLILVIFLLSLQKIISLPFYRNERNSDDIIQPATNSRNLTDKEVQSILEEGRKKLDFIVKTEKTNNKGKSEEKHIKVAYPPKKLVDPKVLIPDDIGPIEPVHGADVLDIPRQAPHSRTNITIIYAPVTLDHSWSQIQRLLFVGFFAVLGSLLNCFYIAAFFVNQALRHRSNVFMACLGLSDLIMTGGVMLISATVLLSGQGEDNTVCNFTYFTAETSCYSYILMFFMSSVQTLVRLRVSPCKNFFSRITITLMVLAVFSVSIALAAVGVFMEMDFDYCGRKHVGNETWRRIIGATFYYILAPITMAILIYNKREIDKIAESHAGYRRSQMYETDSSIAKLNIFIFGLYCALWLPYIYVIYYVPDASDMHFYYSAWTGVFRSIFSPIFYCCVNPTFKVGFASVFSYVFCKQSLNNDTYNSRHRRALKNRPRVHLMQPVVGVTPQRSVSAGREVMELR